jgi:predicted PurR-regulated permease PerM
LSDPAPPDGGADASGDEGRPASRASLRAERAERRAEAAAAAAALDDLGDPGEPFERRSPYFVGFIGGLGLLTAYFLFTALMGISSVLLLIVVALFLAAGLNPAVEFLERRGLSRSWAVTCVIIGALMGLALFLLAIVPVITDQVRALSDSVPGWLEDLRGNRRVQQLDEEYDIIDKVQAYVTDGDFVGTLFGGALGFGLKIVSALFNGFIIVVLTLYFLASLETTKKAIYRLAPASRRDRVTKLGDRVLHNIGGYVSGAFIVAMCAGISSLVFLFAVGLGKYAVALAFVVTVLDVIPMIGATIGAVIVTAIAFATDVKTGIACAIFYIVYQQVENYVIYPRVMRRSVDVPGAVTVIAALVGAALLGVVGALLAIPTAAAVLLVMREVVVKRQDTR